MSELTSIDPVRHSSPPCKAEEGESCRLKLKKPQKYWTPDELDYLATHYDGSESVDNIALHLGRAKGSVLRKAYRIGLRCDNPRFIWTEEELTLLEAWANTKPFPALVQAWQSKAKKRGWPNRTATAIEKVLYDKIGASRKAEVGWYSLPVLAAGLNTTYWVVRGWVRSGALKASKIGDGEHSDYTVREQDLINFALNYPSVISERITPDGMCFLLQVISQSRSASLISSGNSKF